MPYISERGCHGLDDTWEIWNYVEKLLGSADNPRVLVVPIDGFRHRTEDQAAVREHLAADPDNSILAYTFIDPTCSLQQALEYVGGDFDASKFRYLDHQDVCFWEYYMSHKVPPAGPERYQTPFQNDFLCYQRKPNNIRPEVYRILKEHNGIVTLGSVKFDFNNDVLVEQDMLDMDGPDAQAVANDIGTLGNPDIWNSSFLNLVCETNPGIARKFVSEKTFKPMAGIRPWLAIGAEQPYYDMLNTLGYHTFEQEFPDVSLSNAGTPEFERQLTMLAEFLESFDKEQFFLHNIEKLINNYNTLVDAADTNKQRYRDILGV